MPSRSIAPTAVSNIEWSSTDGRSCCSMCAEQSLYTYSSTYAISGVICRNLGSKDRTGSHMSLISNLDLHLDLHLDIY